jgi:hypothetical protein
MNQEEFQDEFDDIMSSGQGEMSDWKANHLTELFDSIPDKEELKTKLEEMYKTAEIEYLSNGELNCVAEYLGLAVEITIVFIPKTS